MEDDEDMQNDNEGEDAAEATPDMQTEPASQQV